MTSDHPVDRVDEFARPARADDARGSAVTQERVHPVAVWRPSAPTAVRQVTAALLLGSSVAAASYVALVIADAPLAEPAAVLAGLCGALPSPWLVRRRLAPGGDPAGARPGVVLAGLICVALIGPPALELMAAALVAGTELLHRRVLHPRFFAAAGALSPAVAAASLLFAAAFAGMPGAIVALPAVAAVKAVVLKRQERA
jgi:hypothetical protein